MTFIRTSINPLKVRYLGTVDYETAWELQCNILSEVENGENDCLLILQHSSIYTAGKRTLKVELPNPTYSKIPVIETNRGGKITWHGPGQLVGYLIVKLVKPIDILNFVRCTEKALIILCAELGLNTKQIKGRSGVWTTNKIKSLQCKVAAIGIRISRTITSHGFALNCDCDLSAYSYIIPCGISDAGVTSLSEELKFHIKVNSLVKKVADIICNNFCKYIAK